MILWLPIARTGVLAMLMLLVGACVSAPSDLGLERVQEALSARTSVDISTDLAFDGGELTLPLAEHLALTNDAQRSAILGRLGIASAELVAAGRIQNPMVSIADLTGSSGGADELILGVSASLFSLLTAPSRRAIANEHYLALQEEAAGALIDLAAETRRDFYAYIEAQLALEVLEQAAAAGQATLALAKRFDDAGNLTRRELAEITLHAGHHELERLSAEVDVARARMRLANRLGLSVDGSWFVATSLPLPPVAEDGIDVLADLAEAGLPLLAQRRRVEFLARERGIAKAETWLDDAEIGYEREREEDGAVKSGPHLSLAIPLFGVDRQALLRADGEFSTAVSELESRRLATLNGMRTKHAELATARSRLARYREDLLPAMAARLDAAQREQNFMLIGVFELLDIRQEAFELQLAYLKVLAAYWQDRSELALLVGQSLPSDSEVGDSRVTAVSVMGLERVDPAPDSSHDYHQHHQHHHHHSNSGADP